jgi:TatD DNase family protein
MAKFYNTHTHAIDKDKNIVSLYNFIVGKDELNASLYSAGIHPWHSKKENVDEQFLELQNIVKEKNCLAIGECGLDKLKGLEWNLQLKIFIRQIKLAKLTNKPLIIHCVKSFHTIMELLYQHSFTGTVLFHGYNSNVNLALETIKNENIFFSFGRSLFIENSNAQKLIQQFPINRFLLETDDSLISIVEIYNKASEILRIEINEMKKKMEQNFKFVFNYGND